MSVLKELAKNPEVRELKEPRLLARELWGLLAPDREPSVWSSAVLDIKFGEPGIKPESPEQHQFIELLKQHSNYDNFSVFLKVNESYNRGEGQAPVSFVMGIVGYQEMQIVDTPEIENPTVLIIREIPKVRGLLRFLDQDRFQIINKDRDHMVAPNVWEPEFRWGGFSDDNMAWRKKFVSEVLDHLIRVGKISSAEQHKEKDNMFQTWVAEHGDPLIR